RSSSTPGATTPTPRSSRSHPRAGAASSRATSTRRMRAAEKLALPAILIGALGLRLWGIHHGLPYAFNVDEGAHFVPRAIGMFGHSLNPQYFVNPPAF